MAGWRPQVAGYVAKGNLGRVAPRHVEHWEAVGPEEFARLTRFEKEQYVYQRLRSEGNWARLNPTERIHAHDYALEVLSESRGGK